MFSSKKNVLETVALIKAYGISDIVLSPGSRNTPLIQTFASDPFFNCHSVVDERSAGFFAIGIINRIQKPVVVCCTSGTALLNYGPAVAEAFYQELPLIVISADRSPAWIGQMDGQTLPQAGVFGSLVLKSVQLPEVHSHEDLWHCNRLVNEALSAAALNGPTHINVPISEPLFDFSVENLPEVRKTTVLNPVMVNDLTVLYEQYKQAEKVLIVVGQMPAYRTELKRLLEKFRMQRSEVVLAEHLANYHSNDVITNFDALISTWDELEAQKHTPDLLITLGGHVVSKRLKKWLRDYPAKSHWHIGLQNWLPDTYQHLTHIVRTTPEWFFESLVKEHRKCVVEPSSPWVLDWVLGAKKLLEPDRTLPFSDITVTGAFLKCIPKNSLLFTGNSSSVRNLQWFQKPSDVPVFCNRGTSGIEGTLSTACGYAMGTKQLVFVILGDLSFFYDLNILTLPYFPSNLRILLLNNGGGGIFKQLPGLANSEIVNRYVSASHNKISKPFIEASNIRYFGAASYKELDLAIREFRRPEGETAAVLEVFTDEKQNLETSKNYERLLKNL